MSDKRGFEVPEELALFSYGFSYKTASALAFMWVLLFAVALAAYVGAGLLDVGNLIGSGTLDAVGGVDRAADYILGSYRPQLLASIGALMVLMLTLERSALVQLAAAFGCVAVHVVLIGTVL